MTTTSSLKALRSMILMLACSLVTVCGISAAWHLAGPHSPTSHAKF